MKLRRLDEAVSVAGQIEPCDVQQLRDLGFTIIVNNRPDGEEPGQPSAAAIEAAAEAAGHAYRFIPIANDLTEDQARQMAEEIEEAEGPLLAFCRSGTRSAYLWALARSRLGEDAEALIGKAAAAGYDLAPIASLLRR